MSVVTAVGASGGAEVGARVAVAAAAGGVVSTSSSQAAATRATTASEVSNDNTFRANRRPEDGRGFRMEDGGRSNIGDLRTSRERFYTQ